MNKSSSLVTNQAAMLKYRYPGANPFSVNQSTIFYGRDQDAQQLFRRIHLEKIVVLHSKSGLGKSSLMNAGLIPLLAEEDILKPIRIHFGAFSAENPETPVTKTNQFLDPDAQKKTFLEDLLPGDNTLWSHLKKHQIVTGQRGYLLVIDQFEELFTYQPAQIKAFAQQLTELQSATVPQRFLEKAEQSSKLEASAIKLLHEEPEVRLLFAIRSDRLHLLGGLATIMPGILSNLYELNPLDRIQAEDAILQPAYDRGAGFLAPPFDIEDEAIEKTLDYLTQEGRQNYVEPYQLQIICQHLEAKVIREKLAVITINDLGNLNQIFENYYHDQIASLPSAEAQQRARLLIEDGLVFEEEERRLTLYEGQIEKTFKVDKQLLASLIDSRLLRAEPSPKGGYTYELSHDTLIRPVLKSRAKRKTEEKRLAAEREKEERKLALAEEQKKRHRATRLAIFGGILALLAILGMVAALWFYFESQESLAVQKELNTQLQVTQDSLGQSNQQLQEKEKVNQELQAQMALWGSYAIILSTDNKRAPRGADYELQLFRERLNIENVNLIKYGKFWYNAVLCENPSDAFEKLPKLKEALKEGSKLFSNRTFGTPWIKWFYDLELIETETGLDNINAPVSIYESVEPVNK